MNTPLTANTSAQMSTSEPETVLFAGNIALLPTIWSYVIAVLTLGLALVVYWIRRKTVLYRVTTERVIVETGLLSKRLEQIDLYRVTDYVVDRPFSQRLAGTGSIFLTTMDKTTPKVQLRCIKADVVALYESLRAATEAQKRRRAVALIDNE